VQQDDPYGGPVGEPVDPYADAYTYVPPAPYGQPTPFAPYPGAPTAPPNPYGFAPYDLRPAPVLAASVLAYVLAGLLIAGGGLLVFGASSLYVLAAADGTSDLRGATGELAVAGLANLVVAAVLITGGVLFSDVRRRRRTILAVGASLTVAECVYWLARSSADTGVFFLAMVYGVLAIATLVMAYSLQSGRWLAGAPEVDAPSATPRGG
jgi:hypothetical protein